MPCFPHPTRLPPPVWGGDQLEFLGEIYTTKTREMGYRTVKIA